MASELMIYFKVGRLFEAAENEAVERRWNACLRPALARPGRDFTQV